MGIKLPSAGNILTGGMLNNQGKFNPLQGGLEGSGIKMGFGGPKLPPPSVSMPPPAARPATLASQDVALAGAQAKMRAAAAEGAGASGTIKTTPEGLQKPSTAPTTLLGG